MFVKRTFSPAYNYVKSIIGSSFDPGFFLLMLRIESNKMWIIWGRWECRKDILITYAFTNSVRGVLVLDDVGGWRGAANGFDLHKGPLEKDIMESKHYSL